MQALHYPQGTHGGIGVRLTSEDKRGWRDLCTSLAAALAPGYNGGELPPAPVAERDAATAMEVFGGQADVDTVVHVPPRDTAAGPGAGAGAGARGGGGGGSTVTALQVSMA